VSKSIAAAKSSFVLYLSHFFIIITSACQSKVVILSRAHVSVPF